MKRKIFAIVLACALMLTLSVGAVAGAASTDAEAKAAPVQGAIAAPVQDGVAAPARNAALQIRPLLVPGGPGYTIITGFPADIPNDLMKTFGLTPVPADNAFGWNSYGHAFGWYAFGNNFGWNNFGNTNSRPTEC